MCVRACMCLYERERERDTEKERGREGDTYIYAKIPINLGIVNTLFHVTQKDKILEKLY